MEILGTFDTSVRRALSEIDPKWESYPGLVVCGSHGPYDFAEEAIQKIRKARETGLPALLICFGQQLACIEYYRHVKGIEDATSSELWFDGTPVVNARPEPKIGLIGGESWWSYYHCDPFPSPENFFVAGYHPEYQSWKGHPHPLLLSFLKYAKKH